MYRKFYILFVLFAMILSCSDDDEFTSNPSSRLTFSVDSVLMDTVFSTVGSSTYSFWVFNNNDEGIRLPVVRLRSGNQTGFRVNVDGSYLDNQLGSVVTDLEVRAGDSIRVFVELTASENGKDEAQRLEDNLIFKLESGVEQSICLRAFVWDAYQVGYLHITSDTTISTHKPIVVYGSILVDSATTLTLHNTKLFFHDKAGLDIHGTLNADSCLFRGDRLDHMFDYLPYDFVSGQWRGLHFYASSTGNMMQACEIRNPETGIQLDSAAIDTTALPRITLQNSIIHNCKGPGIEAFNATIDLRYCQVTNTLGDCVALYGGSASLLNCTLAQFYPFSAERGAALRFSNFSTNDTACPLEQLFCANSILTGYPDDVLTGERKDDAVAFNYYFENCLLKTPADDDTLHFSNIIWEEKTDTTMGKKLFRLIDETNLRYDFHIDTLSVAKGLGCY